jgi:hypothetical protein
VCDLNSFIKNLERQLAQMGPQTRENFAADTGCRKPEPQDPEEYMYVYSDVSCYQTLFVTAEIVR